MYYNTQQGHHIYVTKISHIRVHVSLLCIHYYTCTCTYRGLGVETDYVHFSWF